MPYYDIVVDIIYTTNKPMGMEYAAWPSLAQLTYTTQAFRFFFFSSRGGIMARTSVLLTEYFSAN